MHPMFVTLFIETDADHLQAEEQDRKRHAHAAKARQISRVMSVAAAYPARPCDRHQIADRFGTLVCFPGGTHRRL